MAFKRKYGKRRRRIIKRKRRMLGNNSKRTYQCTFVFKDTVTMNNTGGGSATLTGNYSFNHPGQYINNGGTWATLALAPGIYAKTMSLFGEYRVKALEVLVPNNYVDTIANGSATLNNNLVYIINDYDNLTTVVTEAFAQNSGYFPIAHNVTMRNHRRVMKQTSANKNRWIRTLHSQLSPTIAVTTNETLPYSNNYYGIKLLASNMTATTQNDVIVKWFVQFRGYADS